MLSTHFCHNCQKKKPMASASQTIGLCISCAGQTAGSGVWYDHIANEIQGKYFHSMYFDDDQNQQLQAITRGIGEAVQELMLEASGEIKALENQVEIYKSELEILEQQDAENAPTLKKVLDKLSDIMTFMHSSEAGKIFRKWTTMKDSRLSELNNLIDLKEEQMLLIIDKVENDFSKNFQSIKQLEKQLENNLQSKFDNLRIFMERETHRIVKSYRHLHSGIMNEHVCIICKQFVDDELKPIKAIQEEIIKLEKNEE